MERLSSCYFCGDAVDAALEEYPLVDPRHHTDVETDQRVVLCPDCRRKLTAVIERVLEAALNGDEPDVDAGEIAGLEEEQELVDLDESLEQTDNGEAMTATNVERVDDRGESYSSSTAANDLSSTDEGDSDEAEPDDGDQEANEAEPTVEATSESSQSEAASESSQSEAASESSQSEAASESSQGEAASESSQSEAASESSQGETVDTQAYTRAEHNKVVKLLQNRDFPVEIEEITVVARSAYGIDRDTTHAILEALIERGVVEDQGDHLVRA